MTPAEAEAAARAAVDDIAADLDEPKRAAVADPPAWPALLVLILLLAALAVTWEANARRLYFAHRQCMTVQHATVNRARLNVDLLNAYGVNTECRP